MPLKGSVAETYLAGRGCEYSPPHYWDSALICLNKCKHTPSGKTYPAMLGKVTRWPGQELVALHRTYLKPDGSGKIGHLPARMMLGDARGGAVRLMPHGDRLAIAEGIETALSVQVATGLPAWACLSTGGLQAVILPDEVREVIICADHDPPGQLAAQAAAERLVRQGRRVKIALPPQAGHDFNDMLNEVGHE